MKFLTVLWVICKACVFNVLFGLISVLFIKEISALSVIGLGFFVLLLAFFGTPVAWILLLAAERLPYSHNAALAWFGFLIYLGIGFCCFLVSFASWELNYFYTLISLLPAVYAAVKGSGNTLIKPREMMTSI